MLIRLEGEYAAPPAGGFANKPHKLSLTGQVCVHVGERDEFHWSDRLQMLRANLHKIKSVKVIPLSSKHDTSELMVIRFWTSVWLEFHTSLTPVCAHTCLWFTSHKVVNLNIDLSYTHQYFTAHLWNLTDSHLPPSSTVSPDHIPSNSVTRWSSDNQGHAHLVDLHKLLFFTFLRHLLIKKLFTNYSTSWRQDLSSSLPPRWQ